MMLCCLGRLGGRNEPAGAIRPEQGVLQLRQSLNAFANLRPCHFASKSLVDISPLWRGKSLKGWIFSWWERNVEVRILGRSLRRRVMLWICGSMRGVEWSGEGCEDCGGVGEAGGGGKGEERRKVVGWMAFSWIGWNGLWIIWKSLSIKRWGLKTLEILAPPKLLFFSL